jgi:hypothetical protein
MVRCTYSRGILRGWQSTKSLGLDASNGVKIFMDDDQLDNTVQPVQDDGSTASSDATVGEPEGSPNGMTGAAPLKEEDPYGVKKRLGMQAKRHQREMRMLHDKIAALEGHISSGAQQPTHQSEQAYSSPGQPSPITGGEEERIQRAVRFALEAKEADNRKRQDQANQAYVNEQYKKLSSALDNGSEKYDDFDDVVKGDNVPFTRAIRDMLMFVKDPAEVAYRLGKNPEELSRISKLHPLDQAREVYNLSVALMNGDHEKASTATSPRAAPISNIKANPVSSRDSNNMSVSGIRSRMRTGAWK